MVHKEREEKIAQYWEDNKIFEKSVDMRPIENQYVFYDGPPFATGTPHYGHILGLTSKDLFPRYWTMKGQRCERRWGWDCHGLPIENIAEKQLGMKNKKEIEEMGIDKFNEYCRSKVLFYAGEWKKTVRRMGKWIEFDDSYKTMDSTYMETVWYIFKRLYDEKKIYEGKKVLMYCPHCQTPLANSEIAMDNSYKDVTEKTVTVKLKLKDEDNTYFLAWTTTPWTLIGNVALAVNSKLVYVKIKVGDEFLILAKDLLSTIKTEYEVVEENTGDYYTEKEYEPLYEMPTEGKKGYYVIDGGDEVTAEEGTGIVHMAIYGDFDYEMIKKYDLPRIQHIGKDGKLEIGPEEMKGTWFKKVDAMVLDDLDNKGLAYDIQSYTHSYPFCYRCETPLIYNALDSWFIDIQSVKKKLLERNKDINWYPENVNNRFVNILETAPDWNISRNRFWATAIPVWICDKCNKKEVIGSIKELQGKALETVPDDTDLHKHTMDAVHLKCECGGEMSRIPEVIDCWVESASMPYAAKHYPFENEEWFKTNYPADFISEYVAQVRAWFYYMHVIGVLLFDKAPFKNVAVTGNILAEDGAKMSKSKKNYPDPNDLFDKYGADSLRFYLMGSQLTRAQDINFKESAVEEVYKKLIVILTNVNRFYELFGKENTVLDNQDSEHILDKWILSKLNLLTKTVTEALDKYDTVISCSEFLKFTDVLSTWYVRRSRDRFKSTDAKEKQDAISTLAYVLRTLSKLLAPTTPFISEEIHLSFRETSKDLPESVHLELWPEFDTSKIDEEINEKMDKTREVVSRALEARETAKIPIKQALASLTISGVKLEQEYLDLIADELNVKEVKVEKKAAETLTVELDTNITPELLREGIARELIRKVNNQRKKANLTINDQIVLHLHTNDADINKAFTEHKADILHSVQASSVQTSAIDDMKEIKINDKEVKIGIKVV
jgi:isoleucyl-tRNA synthetase